MREFRAHSAGRIESQSDALARKSNVQTYKPRGARKIRDSSSRDVASSRSREPLYPDIKLRESAGAQRFILARRISISGFTSRVLSSLSPFEAIDPYARRGARDRSLFVTRVRYRRALARSFIEYTNAPRRRRGRRRGKREGLEIIRAARRDNPICYCPARFYRSLPASRETSSQAAAATFPARRRTRRNRLNFRSANLRTFDANGITDRRGGTRAYSRCYSLCPFELAATRRTQRKFSLSGSACYSGNGTCAFKIVRG